MAPPKLFRIFQTYSVLPATGNRNDGPPLFWGQAFKHQEGVAHLHLDGLYPVTEFGVPDGWVVVDWGEDGLTSVMPRVPTDWAEDGAPRIYICSDAHYSEDAYQFRLAKAKTATLTLCNQSLIAERMKADGATVGYLPHAVEPTAYPADPISIPKYDVCFVGHINHIGRAKFLDTMFKAFPNFWFGKRFFEDAARVYRQSKIVLNQAINDDCNMRCFEVCATRSFLLTPWVTDLEKNGFVDGVTCAVYRTTEEAVEKARHYLADDVSRETIAQAGYDLVMSRHTYAHRAAVVLQTLKTLVKWGGDVEVVAAGTGAVEAPGGS